MTASGPPTWASRPGLRPRTRPADTPNMEQNREGAGALNASGVALLASAGGVERAIETFCEAIARFPDVAELHNNLGVALDRAGRGEEAIAAFSRAIALNCEFAEAHASLGHALSAQARVGDAVGAYRRAIGLRPDFLEVHWRLYEVLQMQGEPKAAVDHLMRALRLQQLYSEPATGQSERSVLVLLAAGDWQANVPLDFVLDRRITTVHKFYLADGLPDPHSDALPAYDLVFNAVAQSEHNTATLLRVERFISRQSKPFLNDPKLVLNCGRAAVQKKLALVPGCRVAKIYRRKREECWPESLQAFLEEKDLQLPILIRPIDSQAGLDLLKVERLDQLEPYLAATSSAQFYVMEFIDYRSADGYYRKYRIIFVDGKPFPCHLAISANWMVHYYNALMAEHAWMREEEHRFLADMPAVFDPSLYAAMEDICARVGLDYFGIDCSITPDNKLLVFEADPAMIVHMSDPIELYPYKHEYVPRIIGALDELMASRIRWARGRGGLHHAQ